MENIDPNSVTWWVTAVVAGVVASLLASYLKPHVDVLLAKLWNKWATRTKEKREESRRRFEELRTNPHEQMLAAVRVGTRNTEGVANLVICTFLFFAYLATGFTVLLYVSLAPALFSLMYRMQALGIEAN